MSTLLIIIAAVAVAWFLSYHRLPAVVWTVVGAIGLGFVTLYSRWQLPAIITLWIAFGVAVLLFNPTPVRMIVYTRSEA